VSFPGLIARFGPEMTLMGMGITFFLVFGTLGWMVQNPPDFTAANPTDSKTAFISWDILKEGKFWALWCTLFVSISAGISIISQAAPMAQELHHLTPTTAGKLVAAMAIFNGLGRLFWSSLSDKLGRRKTIIALFSIQAVVFILAVHISNVWLFGAALCYITFCYGGGFGIMPAFTADVFGEKKVASAYGPILSSQAIAGLFGPLLLAYLRESTGGYSLAAYTIAAVLIAACSLPLMVPRRKNVPSATSNAWKIKPTIETLRQPTNSRI